MEENRTKHEVKIQLASNGYVVRIGLEWFVFKELKEVFAKVEEYYKAVLLNTGKIFPPKPKE